MGYADREYSYSRGGGLSGGMRFGGGGFSFSLTPWVKRLLIANAAVFLLMFVGLLPPRWAVGVFGFDPARVLVRPWSPVTYMFLHGGFWHLFVNMLILFFFGPPLERTWGGRKFLTFYLVAGLGGALFSLLLVPVVGSAPVIGASAAIYGLMLAFALLWPDSPIYIWGLFPIKAKWFVGFLALFAFYATFFGESGRVAEWAHLGGLVTGFLYFKFGDRATRALAAWRGRGTGGRRSRSGEAAGGTRRTPDSRPRTGRRRGKEGGEGDSLDEVDRILDKIREQGLDSLDREERAFLDEMSRRYRG